MDTIQETEEKVFSFMEEHHMLQPNDRVVAGVSGGADSVCLLFVLLEWARRTPLSLAVAHVNHGIRPEAAEDARFVEGLCREHGLPFYYYEADVRQKALAEGRSEEEAGRLARYQAFDRAAEDFGAGRIAVAHNSNDRCETMLFHLFRGCGVRGLCGIRPVRDRIIRPILCLERREVEAYLAQRGIACCRDATNEEDCYTRNRIRHHILPYAEREISPGCVAHMAQTAELLEDTDVYLEQQTAEAMQACVRERTGNEGYDIHVVSFLNCHKAIQQRMLYTMAVSLAPGGRDITRRHIAELRGLFTEEGNRSVCLPFGIEGRRRYGTVILERRAADGSAPREREAENAWTTEGTESIWTAEDTETARTAEDTENAGRRREIPVTIPESDTGEGLPWRVYLGEAGILEVQILPACGESSEFPRNQYTKWLDYDKIEQSLVVRTRREGDYLTIAGEGGELCHKSLKKYMITEKVPREERDRVLLLAEGQHVVWLIGHRISEYYKIDRNTKRILQVQLIRKRRGCGATEEEDGGTD